MKRIFCTLAALLILSAGARADEGMWLLPLLQKMNADAMSSLGCRLTPDQIYSINHSSLKDAVVHFGGGCTGEIISDEGLVITNHHCGYSYIQSLSSPEDNYLEDGYWAMTRDKELPAKGLTVTFLQSMTDVTTILEKTYKAVLKSDKTGNKGDDAALAAMNTAKKHLVEAAEADNPGCDAAITSFYNDNVYYLIVSKTYRDVRFVGAPPASLGKFGGDTDNWMWPRHTCDFSMFRVYAGPDNEPADYSPENKPYTPVKSLKVSVKGCEDGDFAMIMGYPGRTQRFQTAAQLRQMLATNDVRIDARSVRQDIMWEARMADPAVNLQYASKYASSSNGWKKWIGMREAFDKLDILGREEQDEAAFTEWVNAKKKRQKAYGNALADIADAVSAGAEAEKAYTLLTESIYRIEIVGFAQAMVRAYNNAEAEDKDASEEELVARAAAVVGAQYKDYNEALDRKEAAALIKHYLANVKPEDLIEAGSFSIDGMDVEAFVNELFEKTAFTSAEKISQQIGSHSDILADPALKLYNSIAAKANVLYPVIYAQSGKLSSGSKAYTAGMLEWKAGEPSYPDANSTMRLTYGTVKSYSPQDAVIYKHYTTLKGVMEKEDPDNYEFRVPDGLKRIWNEKDFGPYANAAGELPTCFLVNCDITGGNSGSPVLNADGELIGLAFDGNWESMSSDVMFEPDLQRCICVDIRYVLLVLDKFGGAASILDEINLVK